MTLQTCYLVNKAGKYVIAFDDERAIIADEPDEGMKDEPGVRVILDPESEEEGYDLARRYGLRRIVETWVLVKTETADDYTQDEPTP